MHRKGKGTQNDCSESKSGPVYDEISATTALPSVKPNPAYQSCELKVEKNPAYEISKMPQSSNPRGTHMYIYILYSETSLNGHLVHVCNGHLPKSQLHLYCWNASSTINMKFFCHY